MKKHILYIIGMFVAGIGGYATSIGTKTTWSTVGIIKAILKEPQRSISKDKEHDAKFILCESRMAQVATKTDIKNLSDNIILIFKNELEKFEVREDLKREKMKKEIIRHVPSIHFEDFGIAAKGDTLQPANNICYE